MLDIDEISFADAIGVGTLVDVKHVADGVSEIISTLPRLQLAIPAVFGHPFRLNPDTHSGVFGHHERGGMPAFV